MNKNILLLSMIITILSVNSLFAGFQFHINPKLGIEAGIANYGSLNSMTNNAFYYKEDLNFQMGYGFDINNEDSALKGIALLFDFGSTPINFITIPLEQVDKNPQFISTATANGIYTGLAINFDFRNNFLLGLASGAKFGFRKDLKEAIIGGYGRITLGYKFFKTEKVAISAMFDIAGEGFKYSDADYYKLFTVDGIEGYGNFSISFGMGFQFGK